MCRLRCRRISACKDIGFQQDVCFVQRRRLCNLRECQNKWRTYHRECKCQTHRLTQRDTRTDHLDLCLFFQGDMWDSLRLKCRSHTKGHMRSKDSQVHRIYQDSCNVRHQEWRCGWQQCCSSNSHRHCLRRTKHTSRGNSNIVFRLRLHRNRCCTHTRCRCSWFDGQWSCRSGSCRHQHRCTWDMYSHTHHTARLLWCRRNPFCRHIDRWQSSGRVPSNRHMWHRRSHWCMSGSGTDTPGNLGWLHRRRTSTDINTKALLSLFRYLDKKYNCQSSSHRLGICDCKLCTHQFRRRSNVTHKHSCWIRPFLDECLVYTSDSWQHFQRMFGIYHCISDTTSWYHHQNNQHYRDTMYCPRSSGQPSCMSGIHCWFLYKWGSCDRKINMCRLRCRRISVCKDIGFQRAVCFVQRRRLCNLRECQNKWRTYHRECKCQTHRLTQRDTRTDHLDLCLFFQGDMWDSLRLKCRSHTKGHMRSKDSQVHRIYQDSCNVRHQEWRCGWQQCCSSNSHRHCLRRTKHTSRGNSNIVFRLRLHRNRCCTHTRCRCSWFDGQWSCRSGSCRHQHRCTWDMYSHTHHTARLLWCRRNPFCRHIDRWQSSGRVPSNRHMWHRRSHWCMSGSGTDTPGNLGWLHRRRTSTDINTKALLSLFRYLDKKYNCQSSSHRLGICDCKLCTHQFRRRSNVTHKHSCWIRPLFGGYLVYTPHSSLHFQHMFRTYYHIEHTQNWNHYQNNQHHNHIY